MSEEISDIIQIANIMIRVSSSILRISIRVFCSIYLGKWHGKESLNRLHSTCGSHIAYLEINSQNSKILNATIAKTLKKYNILYARLPDLNKKDGRTQFAFNADQVTSMQAALNYYASLKNEKLESLKKQFGENSNAFKEAKKKLDNEMPSIKVISANDYAISRLDENGKETPEYIELEQSAKEELQLLESKKKFESGNISTKEKAKKITEIQSKSENLEKLKNGTSKRLQCSEIEAVPIITNNRNMSIYTIEDPVTKNKLLLDSTQILDTQNAIIEPSQAYKIFEPSTGKIKKVSGENILENFKKAKARTLNKTKHIKKIQTLARSIRR